MSADLTNPTAEFGSKLVEAAIEQRQKEMSSRLLSMVSELAYRKANLEAEIQENQKAIAILERKLEAIRQGKLAQWL